jgi:hypothetical protein
MQFSSFFFQFSNYEMTSPAIHSFNFNYVCEVYEEFM